MTSYADAGGDGFYGRWERDSTLGFQIGAQGQAPDLGGAFVVGRWLLVDAAGPTAGLSIDSEGRVRGEVGVLFFPLFPALPMLRLATYRPWLDLWIQSFSVGVGIAWSLRQRLDEPDFYVGLGSELPLWLPTVGGVRGGLSLEARRWWPGFEPADEGVYAWEWRLGVAIRFGLRTGAGGMEP